MYNKDVRGLNVKLIRRIIVYLVFPSAFGNDYAVGYRRSVDRIVSERFSGVVALSLNSRHLSWR